MKYKFKLQFLIIPLIIIPIITITFIFVSNTSSTLQKLQFEKIRHKLDSLKKNCNNQYSILKRSGMETTEFFEKNAKNSAIEFAKNISSGSNYFFILDSSGKIIYHPEKTQQVEKDNFPDIDFIKTIRDKKKDSSFYNREIYGNTIDKHTVFYTYFDKWDWILAATTSENMIYRPLLKSRNIALLTMLVFVVVAVIILFFIARSIARPIETLKNCSVQMGKGDFDIDISIDTGDEFATLATFFNEMANQIKFQKKDLENMQSYLSNILESMPSILISLDENGVITQWNHSAVDFMGISSIDAIGKKILDIAPKFQKYEPFYKKTIETGTPKEFHRELFINGSTKYYNVSIYPLVGSGAKGVVVRIDDITELEEKEMQLRQSQKMETIGTLAGGLAHDFNNVLGGITGTLSIIDFKIKNRKLDLEELDKYLEIMKNSGQRAVDMVAQLLALSHKNEPSFSPVDLNLTIKHVLNICRNSFDKSIRITPFYSEKKAMANADLTQIEQIVLNLCVNASHAMTIMRSNQKWGGELSVSIDSVDVDRQFCTTHLEAREIRYWRISVSDSGIGMDPKTVAKIFDPFFTTKEKGKGTGLGLAMVYNIIRQHNGFIDVYSEVGLGSRFSIYLPFLKKYDSILEKTAENVDLPTGEGVILVIDDEDVLRKNAKDILEESGFEVILAESGKEGITLFKENKDKIICVLLDMAMPEMSGKDVFIELKKFAPDVKVILSSGFRKDKRIDDVMDLGINNFLQKPYTLKNLTDAVFELLK